MKIEFELQLYYSHRQLFYTEKNIEIRNEKKNNTHRI